MVEAERYLPNAVQRICTKNLKLKTLARWMRAQGFAEFQEVVGLRADEPHRVARLLGRPENVDKVEVPLYRAGVTKRDVMAFWAAQPFDLALKPYESNCDGCFLKSLAVRRRFAREHPDRFAWWERLEAERGARFRKDVPSFAEIRAGIERQPELFAAVEDEGGESVSLPCNCTD